MKRIRIDKKLTPFNVVIPIVLLFIGYAIYQDLKEESDIENNRYITVAKITEGVNRRTTGSITYHYYYFNKKFTGIEHPGKSNLKNYENEYYEVYISTRNPRYSKIQLDKNVTDRARIKAAGFE